MLSYLAEKSSVGVKFRCGLSQKFHSVAKGVLLFFPFLHASSLCGNSDNLILILPSQDGCRQQPGLHIVYSVQKKKKREICHSRKSHEVWFYQTVLGHVSTPNQLGGHNLGQSMYPITLVRSEVRLIQNILLCMEE